MQSTAQLPEDIDALKTLVLELLEERAAFRQAKQDDKQEIARLTLLLAKLQRMLFGQKSEKLLRQIEQLELELEELHINQGERPPLPERLEFRIRPTPARRPLPDHLPRETHEHLPRETSCPDCGGAWKQLGEDVSELIEYVPSSFRVVRHVRPRLACTCCDRMAQASAPSRPIARGLAGPGLLAHVFVSKYADHIPLYRQSGIYAREGVELADSTLTDWVGAGHRLLEPLIAALRAHVFRATKLHTDDIPVPVMMPGNGKTRHARLWAYVRDERPCGSTEPAAVWFRYSPDRKGIHPQTHLQHFSGTLQADAFAGYNAIYATGRVTEAACWAHARRKFYEIHADQSTPFTREVLDRIAELYRIEAEIRGSPPERRREHRQIHTAPKLTKLREWLKAQLTTVSRKSTIANAIGYALNQWQALTYFVENGEVEIDNSAAERALRGVALGRKNYLFMGSDRGGERAATMYSLMETAKLNGINPEAYLRHVLSNIADHPVNAVAALLPWNVVL